MKSFVSHEPSKFAEFRRGWLILLAATLGCSAGVNVLPFYSLGSFILPLQNELGWSRSDIASSFLYTTIALTIISPGLGWLIDRIGVRLVALFSIPLLAVVLFMLSRYEGAVSGFHTLYALAAIVGGGATPINYTRAVNQAFDKWRGLALGISLSGVGIIAIVLPPLLAEVIQNHGWRAGYLVLAVLTLLPWPFIFIGIRPNSKTTAYSYRNDTKVEEDFGIGALYSRTFWTIGLSFAAIGIAVSALVVHLNPLLRDAGMDAISAAKIVSIIGFGVLAGRVLVGYVIDRLFAPFVAAALFIATAIGCALLFGGGVALAPAAAVLVGLSLGAEVDLIAYMTARYFGMRRYGFLYAIIFSLFALGAAIGPSAAGALFDASKSYDTALLGVIGLLMGGSLAIITLPRFENYRAQYTQKAASCSSHEARSQKASFSTPPNTKNQSSSAAE